MNTNSPYPQFAPNPNAPLNLGDGNNTYLSDCTNVYESIWGGGGGNYYETPQEACYSCETTVAQNEQQYVMPSGYTFGGVCSNIDPNNPPAPAANTGYYSNCTNYYSEPAPGGVLQNNDSPDPLTACNNCSIGGNYTFGGSCSGAPVVGAPSTGYFSDCINYFMESPAASTDADSPAAACNSCSNLILSGGGNYTKKGTCESLPTLAQTTEGFMLFGGHSTQTGVIIFIVLLILSIAAFFLIKHYSH